MKINIDKHIETIEEVQFNMKELSSVSKEKCLDKFKQNIAQYNNIIAKLSANDNVKKTDEKAVESCTWCAKEGDETICATAETCKDAQKLLLEMAIAH